jgi:hypothetical protein
MKLKMALNYDAQGRNQSSCTIHQASKPKQ